MYEDEIASERIANGSWNTCRRRRARIASGKRLKPASLAVRVKGLAIGELTGDVRSRAALETVGAWKLTGREQQIGGRAVEEIRNRLEFLVAVGLDYLSLERSAATLSGGEAQRIRLATQIGSKLRGVLYVLDEPSIGLHPRDNDRLLDSLAQLARSGQHRAGGGARRRNHRARRLCDRSGSGRGPAGRRAGGAGHSARDREQSRTRSPGNICRGALRIAMPAERRAPGTAASLIHGRGASTI